MNGDALLDVYCLGRIYIDNEGVVWIFPFLLSQGTLG